MGDFSISVAGLADLLDSKQPPLLFDVRKVQAYMESGWTLPSACWRDPAGVDQWAGEIPEGSLVVVYCVHGHEVSRGVGTALRERGFDARVLEGGFEAWCVARGATVPAPEREGQG